VAAHDSQPKRRPGRPPCTVTPEQVRELHGQGMSLRQIARVLRVGKTTVERLLARPFDQKAESYSRSQGHASHMDIASSRPILHGPDVFRPNAEAEHQESAVPTVAVSSCPSRDPNNAPPDGDSADQGATPDEMPLRLQTLRRPAALASQSDDTRCPPRISGHVPPPIVPIRPMYPVASGTEPLRRIPNCVPPVTPIRVAQRRMSGTGQPHDTTTSQPAILPMGAASGSAPPQSAVEDDHPLPVNGRSPGPCRKCGANLWRFMPDGRLDCSVCVPLRGLDS
jgi:hypothetical protein